MVISNILQLLVELLESVARPDLLYLPAAVPRLVFVDI